MFTELQQIDFENDFRLVLHFLYVLVFLNTTFLVRRFPSESNYFYY